MSWSKLFRQREQPFLKAAAKAKPFQQCLKRTRRTKRLMRADCHARLTTGTEKGKAHIQKRKINISIHNKIIFRARAF